MGKTPFDRVIDLLNHDRAEVTWVVRPVLKYAIEAETDPAKPWVRDTWHRFETREDAQRHGRSLTCRFRTVAVPEIERIARIIQVWTKGRAYHSVRIGVTDWAGRPGGDPLHSYGAATGCGYDKRTAALTDCTVGGIELGDHSDYKGRPRLETLCRDNGWDLFGANI